MPLTLEMDKPRLREGLCLTCLQGTSAHPQTDLMLWAPKWVFSSHTHFLLPLLNGAKLVPRGGSRKICHPPLPYWQLQPSTSVCIPPQHNCVFGSLM